MERPVRTLVANTTNTVDGFDYMVLSNVKGVLAVYRVRTVNGEPMPKGLKRWPKELGGAAGG